MFDFMSIGIGEIIIIVFVAIVYFSGWNLCDYMVIKEVF